MIEEEEWSKEQEANRKPGQKHPTPSPGFADRVFYESLLHQRPESKMARKWCLEYGVLKWAEAEALCKELGVPINVTRPGKSPTNAKRATSKSNRFDKQEARAAEELGLGGGAGQLSAAADQLVQLVKQQRTVIIFSAVAAVATPDSKRDGLQRNQRRELVTSHVFAQMLTQQRLSHYWEELADGEQQPTVSAALGFGDEAQ